MKKSLNILIIILVLIFLTNIGLLNVVIFFKRIISKSKCKQSNPNLKRLSDLILKERIIGGHLAKLEESRFFAGIIVKKGTFLGTDYTANEDTYVCGSSIIGKFWALSAAHCCSEVEEFSIPLHKIILRSGTTSWKQSETHQKNMYEHRVVKIIRHHAFEKYLLTNDICLIGVKNNFEKKFGKRINVAGSRYKYTVGDICTAYGFGFTNTNPKKEMATERLRRVDVKIIDIGKCIEWYRERKSRYNADVSRETNVCAGWPGGGRDACRFDSGGPLVKKLNGDKLVLIGIVSFGYNCAEAKFPGIYTKVSAYVQWILDVEKKGVGTGAAFVGN